MNVAAHILSLVVGLMGAEDIDSGVVRLSLSKEFDWAFYSIRWNSLVREHEIPAVAMEDVSPLWCALHCWATDNGEQIPINVRSNVDTARTAAVRSR